MLRTVAYLGSIGAVSELHHRDGMPQVRQIKCGIHATEDAWCFVTDARMGQEGYHARGRVFDANRQIRFRGRWTSASDHLSTDLTCSAHIPHIGEVA